MKRRFRGEADDERSYRTAAAVDFHDLPGYAVTARLLEAMNRVAEQHGARFFVVYIPQRSEIELATPFPYVAAVHAMIDDVCRHAGIAMIDLSAPFHQQAQAGRVLVYPIDAHWTPDGHQLAADVLLSSPLFRPQEAQAGRPFGAGSANKRSNTAHSVAGWLVRLDACRYKR